MSRALWRQLRSAAREDAISLGTSRLPPGIPISMVKVIMRRMGLMPGQPRDKTFLRMNTAELEMYYAGISNILEIPFGDEMHTVPLVMEVDWTADPEAWKTVRVVRENEQFQLSSNLRALTEPALRHYRQLLSDKDKKPLRDDLNLRVKRWDPENKLLSLQPVSYLDTVRTNYTMDYIHAGQSLRERIHKDRRLQGIGKSQLADHLGVDILLFSAEGHLVVGQRNNNLAVTAGRIGPAGAGAMKNEDVSGEHPIYLAELPLYRELFEETALNARDIESMTVLGIVRDLLRGGKPQLCLAVSSNLRSDELCTRLDAAETTEHKKLVAHDVGYYSRVAESQQDYDRLRARLGLLLKQHGDKMTEPLLGALALWWRSLASDAGKDIPPNPSMQSTGCAGD